MPDRVHLCTLSVRTSKAGRTYVTGYLGKAKLIGWAGEPDRYGNRTIEIYAVPGQDARPAGSIEGRSHDLVPADPA